MFDFTFYFIYKFYNSYGEKGAASTSAGIVGGLLASNVITIIWLLCYNLNYQNPINKFYTILIFLFFQITTYVRYIYRDNNSIEIVEKKWQDKSDNQKNKIRAIIYLYIILSILSLLGTAIFLGDSK